MKLKYQFFIIALSLMLAGCDESDVNKKLQKKENIQSAEIVKAKEEKRKAMLNQIPVIKIPDTGHLVLMSNKSLRESRNGYSTQIIAESFTDSGRILTPQETLIY
ncbi:hypothetical protein [Citrobacter sp. U14242]|uniref:hypothetical protein n=1 Tax=Citrobacter sp. U14242 TaxID=3390192 RepID=UPI00397C6A29